MKKKPLYIILGIAAVVLCAVIVIAVSFSGRGNAQPAGNDAQKTEQSKESADLDETVKVQLPLAAIDEEYRNNLDAYCEKYGYTSAKKNGSDGSVTIKMSKFSYELLLTQVGLKVITAVYEVAESGDFPCVKSIEKLDTENFREAVIRVNKSKYLAEGKDAPYTVGQSCLLYQVYDGSTDYKCEVTVVDNKTGEVIETLTYTDKD